MSSWDQVYYEQWSVLVRALIALFGRREGVEDAVQDAFALALTRRVEEFQSPQAWLFTVARNQLRQRYRRQRVARSLGLRPSAREGNVDDAILRIDVIRALHRLSERDRELLIAKYYLGFSQEEIAGHFRVPRGTISSALARAAERFRGIDGRETPAR